ncbi:hypothetical protein I317_00099 [Kwoniella heveanensis CBS 569]|uniref:Uncharacterized protein n=1 Tax=Kwoniella heveanensis BCC8398 TaxID=1296120 RepID=A0A1B9H1P7_9TREE|nr:hypothetical protein I316_01084 [Kwoniella heveanensis BCC8398]OCF46011.1 hypothetical protein I317_00099 [Kwoniella heveanensis CBS 569]
MSLQDRLGTQDALSLLTTGTSLALVTAGSTTGFGYNFPLMLFGIVAHEMHSTTVPFRQFLTLVLFTGIFDIYTLLFHSFGFFTLLFSILLALLKVPIFFTCLNALRERGSDFNVGGWGLPAGVRMPGGGGVSNWNMPMPGGFGGHTSAPSQTAQPSQQGAAPGTFPSSGGFRLGGDDDDQGQGHPTPPPAPGRGGYQTIA